MTERPGGEDASPPGSVVHNQVDHVQGNIVQAGVIPGGVHIYGNIAPPIGVPLIVTADWHRHRIVWVDGEDNALPISGGFMIRILVEGHGAQAVILRELRPVITARRPPRRAQDSTTVAGILPQRTFEIDLDTDPPRLVPQGPTFPFTVSMNDPEEFLLTPMTRNDEVEWHMELHWTSAGREGTIRVPEVGSITLYPNLGKSRVPRESM